MIISGDPEGTVLGPIFFLVVINEIADCKNKCILRRSADDITLYNVVKCELDVLNFQKELNTCIW